MKLSSGHRPGPPKAQPVNSSLGRCRVVASFLCTPPHTISFCITYIQKACGRTFWPPKFAEGPEHPTYVMHICYLKHSKNHRYRNISGDFLPVGRAQQQQQKITRNIRSVHNGGLFSAYYVAWYSQECSRQTCPTNGMVFLSNSSM